MTYLLVMSIFVPILYLFAPNRPSLFITMPVVFLISLYWLNIMFQS
jgi:hypothetical protein